MHPCTAFIMACYRKARLVQYAVAIAMGWCILTLRAIEVDETRAIQPSAENPWYWQYNGKTVLLLGGTKDDNLFQIPDLKNHIDELASAGGNFIRNTMSDRRDGGFEVYPFRQLPNGNYDLNEWNDEYWRRFENMLQWTHGRAIVVQIEVWDRFDYSRNYWEVHPYNPKNNVNYTYEESGFQAQYPDHPGRNVQPFFFTTPYQQNNTTVFRYQRRFVDKMLEHALRYDHVLYCIDNETSGDPNWSRYWAEYIHQKAKERGRRVFVTEMWDDWNITTEQHRRTYDHPEIYDFVELSQNNHNRGQKHWDNLQWVRNHLLRRPRPMNTVKTYGADGGRYGTTLDGIERWWRHLIGGVAAVRFHRPDSGIGLNAAAQASIRAARKLESVVPLWTLQPDLAVLKERQEDEAYAAARPGHAYVVFFPGEGEVALDLRAASGRFQLRWISIDRGDWGPTAVAQAGDWLPLRTPQKGNWVVAVVRHEPP